VSAPAFETVFEADGLNGASGDRQGGSVGMVGIAGFDVAIPTIPTIPARLLPREPAWPEDSILQDYIEFARDYSESEDSILIGSLLPVVAAFLRGQVYIKFNGKKYPNIYSVLVTRPGFRKTTTIGLAERLGRLLLPPSTFLEGATSPQALFKLYQNYPNRLLLEDEGNTLLSNWASDAAGKQVAKQFLKLYDCKPWQQAYVKQAENGGEELQRIEETTTSLLIGTTYNNCRFNGIEARDGLRRRVNYYTSEKIARTIDWPEDHDSSAFLAVRDLFEPLLNIDGEFERLSGSAFALWRELQRSNRAEIERTVGTDAASEAHSSALAEENAKILKFAMLFEVCRWAKDQSRNWKQIQADTLQLAATHVHYCLGASQQLDQIGRRAEIRNAADSILAAVLNAWIGKKNEKGTVGPLTRTDLTNRFAANPARQGSLTPERLYNEIIPDLQKRRLASVIMPASNNGRLHHYYFREDAGPSNEVMPD
jgi:hypothetical protein